MKNVTIHPLADVQTSDIGDHTVVWQFAIILKGAVIGSNCNVNCHTFIEGGVTIGNNVTVKAGVFLWEGITVEDNVFLGPNATFINDLYPKSKQYPDTFIKTTIRNGASIGANATIMCGVTIGENALVGAGSVVLQDVPPNTTWVGNPARQIKDNNK